MTTPPLPNAPLTGLASQVCPARVVSAVVTDPVSSIFKESRNTAAQCLTIVCTLKTCPLRDAGTCVYGSALTWNRCPYGHRGCSTGFTRRACRYRQWIAEQREQYAGVPHLAPPTNKMAIIGNYVFLPYRHMTMDKRVPFLGHASLASGGNCFLPIEHWTLATVEYLLDFHPRAFMGGEITGYQEKEVPRFLAHLRETDATMWGRLIQARPKLDVAPNYVGRNALLRTLAPDIRWTTGHARHPVEWHWDGRHVRSTSEHVYSETWGDVALRSMELVGIPAESATVVVQDNAWITEDTIFVD